MQKWENHENIEKMGVQRDLMISPCYLFFPRWTHCKLLVRLQKQSCHLFKSSKPQGLDAFFIKKVSSNSPPEGDLTGDERISYPQGRIPPRGAKFFLSQKGWWQHPARAPWDLGPRRPGPPARATDAVHQHFWFNPICYLIRGIRFEFLLGCFDERILL